MGADHRSLPYQPTSVATLLSPFLGSAQGLWLDRLSKMGTLRYDTLFGPGDFVFAIFREPQSLHIGWQRRGGAVPPLPFLPAFWRTYTQYRVASPVRITYVRGNVR